jgi:hypothetical protein
VRNAIRVEEGDDLAVRPRQAEIARLARKQSPAGPAEPHIREPLGNDLGGVVGRAVHHGDLEVTAIVAAQKRLQARRDGVAGVERGYDDGDLPVGRRPGPRGHGLLLC